MVYKSDNTMKKSYVEGKYNKDTKFLSFTAGIQ